MWADYSEENDSSQDATCSPTLPQQHQPLTERYKHKSAQERVRHTEPQILATSSASYSSVHSRRVSTPRVAGLVVGVVKYLLFGVFVLGLNRLHRYLRARGRSQTFRLLSEVYIIGICIEHNISIESPVS